MENGNISPSARLIGQTQVLGDRTRIGPGATVENCYLENAVVEEGAHLKDSVLITRGEIEEHKCDSAGKWTARGAQTAAGKNSRISGSTLINAAIGERTCCVDSHIEQAVAGPRNTIQNIKGLLFRSGARVRLLGPTEISEAWLGDHATIDQCGYFEGVFANDFHIFEFDAKKRRIDIVDTLELPHLSRYGMNTINSTNSGNVLPQPDDRFAGFGPVRDLWFDNILSHEPILLSPCCWVSGWTKIIGKSMKIHNSAENLIEDPLATHLMPFSTSGLSGGSVMGQVTIGELSNAYSYKHRVPLWTFTYACGAVIDMVQSMHAIVKDAGLIDELVSLSLKNALALTRFYASERDMDIDTRPAKPGRGWRGWLIRSKDLIEKHLASELWRFENGEPVNWRQESGRWIPRDEQLLRAIAPDAPESQVSEENILKCGEAPLVSRMGIAPDERYAGDTHIDGTAEISPQAHIGEGVSITGHSRIAAGVRLYGARIHDSVIGENGKVLRSSITGSEIGADLEIISSSVAQSNVGDNSTVHSARIDGSDLGERSTISPFADIQRSRITRPVIAGGNLEDAEIHTILMSMHMAGKASGLKAHPLKIDIAGETKTLYPIPMLGGGCRLLGSREKPVDVECSFIGSNAIVEGGAYVGFGSFVLGRLAEEEGLPPFTVSTEAGPEKDQIGGVLSSFANMVITHFISWAYQGNGTEKAPLICRMIEEQIREGHRALEWAASARENHEEWNPESPYARFKSLKLYTDAQLQAGRAAYARELAESKWSLEYTAGELAFCGKGHWNATDGALRWEAGD